MSFCKENKSIFISLSPNVKKDDLILALRLVFQPWKWTQGKAIEALEAHFKRFLGVNYAFTFNSGRSGFLAILKALELKRGDEVLIQGFTCNALVNPITWSGLKPIFIDINRNSLNIDPEDLKRKITGKSRVVVVQHTFGLPAKIGEILNICNKNNLILIEDCAHSLGAEYKGRAIGTFGRASFFSLGRDKIVSSVYGGIAVTNDEDLAQKIKDFQKDLTYPSYLWIFQQLLHPILNELLVKPLYNVFGFGRWVLIGLQKTRILSKAVHKKEKQGKKPEYLPQKMPNALVVLGIHQFKSLNRIIEHQREIAGFYNKELKNLPISLPKPDLGRVYMRYSILVQGQDTDKILREARKQKIFLDDGWRITPIVPYDTDQEKMGYSWGDCPGSERVAREIINLPTHINTSIKGAGRIVKFLKCTLKR